MARRRRPARSCGGGDEEGDEQHTTDDLSDGHRGAPLVGVVFILIGELFARKDLVVHVGHDTFEQRSVAPEPVQTQLRQFHRRNVSIRNSFPSCRMELNAKSSSESGRAISSGPGAADFLTS